MPKYRLIVDPITGCCVPDYANPILEEGETAPPPKKEKKAKKASTPKKKAKEEKSSLPAIDISGARYSENVIKQVLKDFGLKAKLKKAVIGAALSQDEDLNRYLNKDELEAGAAIVSASEE